MNITFINWFSEQETNIYLSVLCRYHKYVQLDVIVFEKISYIYIYIYLFQKLDVRENKWLHCRLNWSYVWLICLFSIKHLVFFNLTFFCNKHISNDSFVVNKINYTCLSVSVLISATCNSWSNMNVSAFNQVVPDWQTPLKGLAHAKIIKKSVILFRVLNMTIWCKHVHRLELQIFKIFVLRIHQLG